jgi:2-haloacid dehalogenase
LGRDASAAKETDRGGTAGSTTQDRWATFDCYGTLIDWNGGIRAELERLFGVEPAPRLLARYHELEPAVQREHYRTYREVLTLTMLRLAEEESLAIPEGESDALARALPDWEPFAEVPATLEELRRRGWRLAILSNTDRDLLDASKRRIGVAFDRTVVAEDVDSYKPAHRHWEEFFARTEADRWRHVHVAASLFHDIAPASELGLASVWVNRLGEEARPKPTREIPDLSTLPDVLDELVAA